MIDDGNKNLLDDGYANLHCFKAQKSSYHCVLPKNNLLIFIRSTKNHGFQ